MNNRDLAWAQLDMRITVCESNVADLRRRVNSNSPSDLVAMAARALAGSAQDCIELSNEIKGLDFNAKDQS